MKYKIFVLLFILNFSFSSQGQIITNEREKPKESVEKPIEKEVRIKDTTKRVADKNAISIYLEFAPGTNNIELDSNTNAFGKNVGERANEQGERAWTYGLGFRLPLKSGFVLQAGLTYFSNRESYSFQEVDTAYSYTTNYRYFGMPIKLYYEFERKLNFKIGVGLMPQMLNTYSQKGEFKSSNGNTGSFENKTRDGFNPFVLSALLSAGISYRFTDNLAIHFVPEYRRQIASTYLDNEPFVHKAHTLTYNFGLYFFI